MAWPVGGHGSGWGIGGGDDLLEDDEPLFFGERGSVLEDVALSGQRRGDAIVPGDLTPDKDPVFQKEPPLFQSLSRHCCRSRRHLCGEALWNSRAQPLAPLVFYP